MRAFRQVIVIIKLRKAIETGGGSEEAVFTLFVEKGGKGKVLVAYLSRRRFLLLVVVEIKRVFYFPSVS